MDIKKDNKTVIVTGYFGAPLRETAEAIARDEGRELVVLDDEIAAADGRSITRICMLEGEHSYRNKEYELLQTLTDSGKVILCGDGVLHDDMSRELIEGYRLVIAGSDMSEDELWEGALSMADTTYHAFMKFGSDEEKREAFAGHTARQKILFEGEKND